jgi:hypothetical protein
VPGLGAGGLFQLDVQWTLPFAAGLKGSYDTNFHEYTAGDLQAFFRWYFLQSFMPIARKYNFFVQGEGGIVFQREPIRTSKHEPYEVVPGLGGGLVVGTRISLKPNWYLEPYVRTGYPWLWGVGATVGWTFPFRYANQNGYELPGESRRDLTVIVVNYNGAPQW